MLQIIETELVREVKAAKVLIPRSLMKISSQNEDREHNKIPSEGMAVS